jgi:hypothetical protein
LANFSNKAKKLSHFLETKLVVDREHYHNGAGILKVVTGLTAVLIITSHVPYIKIDLACGFIHLNVHQFMIVCCASSWGFISVEASIDKLSYDRCFAHVRLASKNNLGFGNFITSLLKSLMRLRVP